MGRNQYLHETERIHELSGKDKLTDAIRREYNIGIGSIPAAEGSYMFRMKIEELLSKDIQYLKDWLVITRQSRKVHKDPELINDEITENKALRKWIGINAQEEEDEE